MRRTETRNRQNQHPLAYDFADKLKHTDEIAPQKKPTQTQRQRPLFCALYFCLLSSSLASCLCRSSTDVAIETKIEKPEPPTETKTHPQIDENAKHRVRSRALYFPVLTLSLASSFYRGFSTAVRIEPQKGTKNTSKTATNR